MIQKLFFSVLTLCLLCNLFSCAQEEPTTSQIKPDTSAFMQIPQSSDDSSDFVPSSTDTRDNEDIPDMPLPQDSPTTSHTHGWVLASESASTCTLAGKRILRCTCGEEKTESLPTNHTLTSATCTTPATCTRCGLVQGKALEHIVSGDVCARCGEHVTTPIYVLGKQLSFDEKTQDILSKLGNPTETIREGDLVSLVYAEDLSRFTVIQTDQDGLWGVFTFDVSARMLIEKQSFTISTFSGARDENSEASFQDVGSCRIYGFRDSLGDGKNYALWFRYSECRYDYINDPRLYSNLQGQSKLSYYYVNALRYRHGLSPVLWSDQASKVARDYSAYMIEKDFFGHDNKYGERLTAVGVSWHWAGENISQGYFNALFVCDAYYHSQGHRDNILSSNFTHVGIGFCRRSNDSPLVLGGQIFYS